MLHKVRCTDPYARRPESGREHEVGCFAANPVFKHARRALHRQGAPWHARWRGDERQAPRKQDGALPVHLDCLRKYVAPCSALQQGYVHKGNVAAHGSEHVRRVAEGGGKVMMRLLSSSVGLDSWKRGHPAQCPGASSPAMGTWPSARGQRPSHAPRARAQARRPHAAAMRATGTRRQSRPPCTRSPTWERRPTTS